MRRADAVEKYKKAIEQSPKSAQIHARLAAVYVDLDRIEDAKAAVNEILRLAVPQNPVAIDRARHVCCRRWSWTHARDH